MEEQTIQLITPGVYRKISTRNDDKPELVRIMGPVKGKTGYWQAMGTTQKQEIYHEGELTSAWELMDIHASAEHKNAAKRKEHLFAGIPTYEELQSQQGKSASQEEEEINQRQAEYRPGNEKLSREPAVYRPAAVPVDPENELRLFNEKMGATTEQQPIQPQQQAPPTPERQFLNDLFARLAKSQESEDELEVTVRIPLGFNMNKLKESINLLDLDIVEVAAYVTNSVLSANKLKASVSSSLTAELARPLIRASDRLRELQTTKPEVAPFADRPAPVPVPEPSKDDLVQAMPPMVQEDIVAAEVDELSVKTSKLLEKFL